MSTRGPVAAICPICKKPAQPRSENRSFPFCSPRCKEIDMGNWFNEAYRVPTDEPPEEGDAPPREPNASKSHDVN